MNVELNGTIKIIGQTQQVSDKFAKREAVIMIDTDTQYPQPVPFQFTQDKCGVLDGFQVGQNVKVSCNIRGNEFNSKFYINLQAWKIEPVGAVQQQPTQTATFEGGKVVTSGTELQPQSEPLPF